MGYRQSLERITGIGSLLDGRRELCDASYDLLRHADIITGEGLRSWENERVDGKLLLVGGDEILNAVYAYLRDHDDVILRLQTGWPLQIRLERINQRFPLFYAVATQKSFQAQPMNAQMRAAL